METILQGVCRASVRHSVAPIDPMKIVLRGQYSSQPPRAKHLLRDLLAPIPFEAHQTRHSHVPLWVGGCALSEAPPPFTGTGGSAQLSPPNSVSDTTYISTPHWPISTWSLGFGKIQLRKEQQDLCPGILKYPLDLTLDMSGLRTRSWQKGKECGRKEPEEMQKTKEWNATEKKIGF